MAISCECDFDEPCTVWREQMRRAAKRHRCSDCGGIIPVGQGYTNIAMLSEGEWTTAKRCADCQHLIYEVERRWMGGCGGKWCVWIGDLPMSWESLMESAMPEDREDARRIVAMQRAATMAREGNRFWSLPLWMTEEDE